MAFGTDSLASVADLNLFAELAEARRLAPRVPARRLLESATLIGARALGFGDEFGSIEAGKRAALIAVRIPAGVDDVEEYLVGGIEPDDDHVARLTIASHDQTLTTYLSFVRFSHSVFALPFALTGALLAWREHPFSWAQVGWIVVCMVARAAPRWGSTGWSTRDSTRSIRARRCASCRAAR